MSIDKIGTNDVMRAYLQSAESQRANGAQQVQAQGQAHKGHGARKHDEVSLSDEAKSLASARQAVNDAPDVREGKVREIRQSIQDGTYSVSPRALAQTMLDQSQSA